MAVDAEDGGHADAISPPAGSAAAIASERVGAPGRVVEQPRQGLRAEVVEVARSPGSSTSTATDVAVATAAARLRAAKAAHASR